MMSNVFTNHSLRKTTPTQNVNVRGEGICFSRECNEKPLNNRAYCQSCWDEKVEPLRKYDDSGRLKANSEDMPQDEKIILWVMIIMGIGGWLWFMSEANVNAGSCFLLIGILVFVGFIRWLTQSMFWR